MNRRKHLTATVWAGIAAMIAPWGCGSLDIEEVPGDYALEKAFTADDTVQAGEHSYGAITLHPGGKLTGETKIRNVHREWLGSWSYRGGVVRLFLDRDSMIGSLDGDGVLRFQSKSGKIAPVTAASVFGDADGTWNWRLRRQVR